MRALVFVALVGAVTTAGHAGRPRSPRRFRQVALRLRRRPTCISRCSTGRSTARPEWGIPSITICQSIAPKRIRVDALWSTGQQPDRRAPWLRLPTGGGNAAVAVADGTVLFAGLEPHRPQLGRTVQALLIEIVHLTPSGDQFAVLYGHLSRIDVATGATVSDRTRVGCRATPGAVALRICISASFATSPATTGARPVHVGTRPAPILGAGRPRHDQQLVMEAGRGAHAAAHPNGSPIVTGRRYYSNLSTESDRRDTHPDSTARLEKSSRRFAPVPPRSPELVA